MMETIDMLIDARMEMKFKSFNQYVDEFRQSYDQKLYYIQLEIKDEINRLESKLEQIEQTHRDQIQLDFSKISYRQELGQTQNKTKDDIISKSKINDTRITEVKSPDLSTSRKKQLK